jgi:hypothetical protein
MKRDKEAQFKNTLRRGARLALITGKINLRDWLQVQGILLKSKRTTPEGVEVDVLDEIAQDIVANLQDDNKVGAEDTVDSIDWTKVLDFVTKMMPVVMQFIAALMAMFGGVTEEVATPV